MNRRLSLALCAALLALTISLPTPAYASANPDVPPTVFSARAGELTVLESTAADRSFVYANDYIGFWPGWQKENPNNGTPFLMQGNASGYVSGGATFLWTQLADGALYCEGSASQWVKMTDTFLSGRYASATPAVYTWPAQILNSATIIAIDNQGRVLRGIANQANCNPATLSGFGNMGGGLSNWSPAVAGTSGISDELVVVAGTDNYYYSSYNGGPWARILPQQVGGTRGAPALTTWGGGRYDLFIRGTDGALWHNPNNQYWESLGGGLNAGPGCVAWAANRIDCFIAGTDPAGNIYHKWWDGTQWLPAGFGNFENLGTA